MCRTVSLSFLGLASAFTKPYIIYISKQYYCTTLNTTTHHTAPYANLSCMPSALARSYKLMNISCSVSTECATLLLTRYPSSSQIVVSHAVQLK